MKSIQPVEGLGRKRIHERTRRKARFTCRRKNPQRNESGTVLLIKSGQYTNLEQAFYDVKKNRGAHGVDTITIKEYELELEHNLRVLQQSLRDKYVSCETREKSIYSKGRWNATSFRDSYCRGPCLQAAVKRKLEPIFEEKFLPCSFGFRPDRSAHMAMRKSVRI